MHPLICFVLSTTDWKIQGGRLCRSIYAPEFSRQNVFRSCGTTTPHRANEGIPPCPCHMSSQDDRSIVVQGRASEESHLVYRGATPVSEPWCTTFRDYIILAIHCTPHTHVRGRLSCHWLSTMVQINWLARLVSPYFMFIR
jgi:hypothetical protein